ncbi:PucR family transcriptional regulator [Compostimonas suwonensis]|uniref:DNA-binding PucR family transcriptional regulator n=1 Tax=Compostimonas suwonensis TaxID=1048394 RepID=A0A2M9C006_9MICO|nr:helix-turn-helix domain-containing protein [Compostimonas suwonensis]PJJ63644.1 DNA-binding PucR family transcriptional regulator [Compostimonas suwonensis]
METTLQRTVDLLAERIGRPAVLEDGGLRLLAFSTHTEPLDPVRERSILRREASDEVRRYLMRFIRNARHPVRVPGDDDLELESRLCVPVVDDGEPIAYVWFVDPDSVIDAGDADWCCHQLSEIADGVRRSIAPSGLHSMARASHLVRSVLTDDETAQESARELVDGGYLSADRGVAAVVFRALDSSDAVQDAFAASAASAFDALLLGPRRQSFVHAVHDSALVCFVSSANEAECRATVTALQTIVAKHTQEGGARLVTGVGGIRLDPADARASYREALVAARAADGFPHQGAQGSQVYWPVSGANELAARIAVASEADFPLHPGFYTLLDDPEAGILLETLETYLDVAGNVQTAAAKLHLHRTSLYYRLHRIEKLASTDLKDGGERLNLHLSLKVAMLRGHYLRRRASLGRIAEEDVS